MTEAAESRPAGSLARRLEPCLDETFDWLVVGGGVYGVALTFEAARRGQRVLLLEADDFGGATTWHSLRILHGGLRYLQSLDLGRFRQSVAERQWFLRHFPDQTAPLDCLMPLYGTGLRRPAVFRLAFLLDHLLGLDRNQGVEPSHHLAAGRVLSPAATRELVPGLAGNSLAGGALWQDGAMPRSETLLIEWLRWATALGARALNRMRVERLLVEAGRVTGVEAVDALTGETHRFRAAAVANAAGPWCRALAATADDDRPELFHASLAFNLLLDRAPPAGQLAVTVEPPGAGTLFLHPHGGRLLVGTWHLPCAGHLSGAGPLPEPAATRVPATAIEAALRALDAAFPGLALDAAAVLEVRAGYLPALAPGSAVQAKRPVTVDHGAAGGPAGLFSISGVKWTTARRVAADFFAARGIPAPATTPSRPQPAGWDQPAAEAFLALPADAARAWLDRLIRERAVFSVEDVLCRRTGWSAEPQHAAALRARLRALWPAGTAAPAATAGAALQ